MFYTFGQRQGLHIGGIQNGFEAPWYVVDKDIPNNALIVAQGNQHPMLYAQGLLCSLIHWINPVADSVFPITCFSKTRYRQTEQACVVSQADEQQHIVLFSQPQRAVTPGQYIVFYHKNECLGGAVIEKIIR